MNVNVQGRTVNYRPTYCSTCCNLFIIWKTLLIFNNGKGDAVVIIHVCMRLSVFRITKKTKEQILTEFSDLAD